MSDFVDNWDNPLEGIEPDILEELMKNPRYREAIEQSLDWFPKLERFRKENGIYFYNPLPKCVAFHKHNPEIPFTIRLLHGANRSSKTTTGSAEDVWYATGLHPHKKIKTPNEGWVVSKDYNAQKEGVQASILKYLPKCLIKDISHVKSEVIDTIWVIPHDKPANTPKSECSKITFKSCDSGVEKFGGAAKRWIHFDEEPTRAIYQECIARIGAGMPLDIWLTMTPIWEDKGKKIGMTWTYREIYKNRDQKRIFTLGVGIEDNIYLSKEQIEDQKKKYFGVEYDIRIKGDFKLLAGNQVFDPQAIERHDATCTAPQRTGILEWSGSSVQFRDFERGYLKVWDMPKSGRQYAIGADVGLGVGGDPSSASVRGMDNLVQVAEVNGQIAPDKMGEILIKLGTWYNKAWIGVEANSFGIATLDAMKHQYSKLYYRYKVDQRTDRKTKQIGWWTDTKTKPIMISDYGRAMREDALTFRSSELLDECMTYVIGEDGNANAESGCHDDRVIADMICLQVRKRFHMTSASVELESFVPSNKNSGY